jgi:hypothetical protein
LPSIGEGLLVPRYFFAIRGTAKEEDDPQGTILPNDAAALSYAERTITQYQKEDVHHDPGMIMIVRNDSNQIVWSIPFLPAYA